MVSTSSGVILRICSSVRSASGKRRRSLCARACCVSRARLRGTDRLPEIFLRAESIGSGVGGFQAIRQPAQIGVVSFGILRRFGGDDLLFVTGEFRLQSVRDGFGYLTLDREDVS